MTNEVLKALRELAENGDVTISCRRATHFERPGYRYTVSLPDEQLHIAIDVDDAQREHARVDADEQELLRGMHALSSELRKRKPALRSV